MHNKLSIFCIPVRCLLFASLLFLLLGAGCKRKAVAPEPKGPAIPPTTSAEVTAPTDSQEADAKKIILFGTVVSVEDSSLVIEVPEPVSKDEEVEILWWEIQPGLDMNNRRTTVFIEPNTYIQIQEDDLKSLKLGMQIMIGGAWLGNGIAADLIVDYHMMEKAISESRLKPVQAEGAWRKLTPEERPAWFDKMPEIEISGMPGGGLLDLSAIGDTKTLQFPGEFGNPTYAWDSGDLDIIIPGFPLLGWTEINNFSFIMGLGGAYYNFPFSFKADAPNPLIVDSSRYVEITVQPQPPPSGTFSFYWAYGWNFHAEYRMCYLGGLFCFNYVWNLNIFSQVNATKDPAPMPGEILRILDYACPGFDIEIFSIELCTSMRILGDYFYSNGHIHDSLYMPLHPGWRYWYSYFWGEDFDGTSRSFPVWPATNPLNIDLSEFLYEPVFEIGYKGQVCLVGFTIYETPVGWVYGDNLRFVPTYYDECWVYYDFFTCGPQPKDVTLTLPVVPVVTSLTSPDTISRYGDIVTLYALVRGANGPGTSPKQVSFYKDNTLLATEPIDAQDVATFQTSTLNPCKHVITAKYIGYDDQGNTYPTEKSLTLIVTADAELTRLAGYWQHQYSGNGRIDFGDDSLQCYLDIVNHMSAVFSEVRDASTIEKAHDILFLKQNDGSAIEQFDRDLLVLWLNFASGGILHTQLVDTDKDGIGETPLIYVVMAAESVRLDPNATKNEIKEQTSILHRIVAQYDT